jgi:hypothetical protein
MADSTVSRIVALCVMRGLGVVRPRVARQRAGVGTGIGSIDLLATCGKQAMVKIG